MNTAHQTDQEKKEFFDKEDVLEQKIVQLAEWIKQSKHFVVFTGAGISTSAGIKDFRSGVNTVLPTGPGAWEKLATKTNAKPKLSTKMASAIPTPCHMALVKLQQAGYLKFLISQNVDGLHRKSGFPAKKLAELHGNTYLEVCKEASCKKQYLRDFHVRTAQKVHDHETSRKCESCGKPLYDSIINFGENLSDKELNDGFDESAKADLCLVLGSSLRVTPAANMPEATVKKGGKLVIVNLQETPLDSIAFRINGLVDDVVHRLMEKLNLSIPAFKLPRHVSVMKSEKEEKTGFVIRGVDEEGSPYSLFKGTFVAFENKERIAIEKEPYWVCPSKQADLEKGVMKVTFLFQGHYGEPIHEIEVALESLTLNEPAYYFIEFDPSNRSWSKAEKIAISAQK